MKRSLLTCKSDLMVFIMLVMACVVCYFFATNNYLFWEVSWHIEGANRMLHGGSYLTNLFDDNPPMVFMYFLPLALIKSITGHLNVGTAYVYILACYLVAFITSYWVLKTSQLKPQSIYFILSFIVIGVLCVAVVFLGQREVNAVCLMTPYLLINLFDEPPNNSLSLIAAILAAIGINQAPFYLLVPLCVDLLSFSTNHFRLNKTQVIFYIAFIVITITTYLLYPGYYGVVLPLVAISQAAINTPSSHVLINLVTVFCFPAFIVLALSLLGSSHKKITLKFILLFLSSFIIYFFEHKDWGYHFYPVEYFIFFYFPILVIIASSDALIKITLISIYSITVVFLIIVSFSSFQQNYQYMISKDNPVNQLVSFERDQGLKNDTYLFFSTRVTPTYLFSLYSGARVISPWSNNWMLPAIIQYENDPSKSIVYHRLQNQFFALVIASLRKKPDYIVYPAENNIPYMSKQHFDFLSYLQQNTEIANELLQYRLYQHVGNFLILKKSN